MDGAEREIAVLDRVDDDAKAENVGKLFEGQRLGFHLAEDGPGLLLPALHLGMDLVFLEKTGERLFDLGQHALVALEYLGQPRRDHLVGFGIDVAEGEIFQFFPHPLHAHAARQRCIDLHRLLGDAQALVLAHVIEGAHVVQPVGELDQENADVLGDREQQLAQVFRLLSLLGDEVELLQLGQSLDQLAHFRSEEIVDLLAGSAGILDRVVQQGRGDRGLVHVHVGEDRGDFERMREIGVARGALLVAMLLHGIDVSLVEQRLVHVRLVALDALDKLVLTHHGRFLTQQK